MNTPPITYITIQGIRTAEAVIGEGKPLVLLHGWGANIGLVWALAEQMSALGYRVYALDLPGFGASDPPPTAWTVYDYARFVVAYWDAHQLDKVYLFGHSFGGRLSLILGAEQSERIVKMALANSAGIKPPTSPMTRARLTLYKFLRDGLYRVGARGLADQLRTVYNKRYGSSDFQQVSGIMRQTFVNVVNEDLLGYAARAKPPTLLFWGDQDNDTPLWYGQTLEKTMPDAGLIVYPGAGHYSYLEHLPEVVRVMDYFFKH